ncbi:Imidazole glycerol phosphate synthase subunit HisH [hisH] [Acididesulfobacillus acetoxydans]|uniref:Imidazole glycerol phosphate synthase subunit HisH n=1 Tax=Acididesulfobacillus acetoxydans TaxID=1561005 RepID=A0A8S0XZ70_9FIRM|nr:imidazole glycerol phosphate synthase subunit HisH [Acididesulfobacillus acetoxydans]CAA7602407.1 Imidazole glycerol phosphate synthase subunit HisH [hisH] [Acididesulfobacillus acetoxydans]CEJ08358.1 Imidazole glycerol phosphate synthase subunit HisH [Acididesulfobacillus acetoxydans]
MIGIIDYGRGNLRSVEKALAATGFEAEILTDPAALPRVGGLILPGVGAFADAMAALRQLGWVEPLVNYARSGAPFLGICLGMQVLFELGEEHGAHEGLGLLPGRVVKFPPGRKIPHMGWNTVHWERDNNLVQGIPAESWFYFVHSFYVSTPDESVVVGRSEYGVAFPALVGRGNIWGTQFHPEKSSRWGLKILENFGRRVEKSVHLSGN